MDTNDATFADRPLVVREIAADTSISDNTDTTVALLKSNARMTVMKLD